MFPTLVRAAIEGAIVVALIWIVSRTSRRLSPATQAILWWCAAVKFLIALLWTAPISLPLLPVNPAIQTVSASASPQIDAASPVPRNAAYQSHTGARFGWASALVAMWAVGCLAATATALRRSRQMLALINRAAWAPAGVQTMASELAGRFGLKHVPAIRVSDDVETPLVAGLRRPTILLPAHRFLELPSRQQQMVLGHELAHVKRADLWLGCAPALAERLFFFHPLVRLATREYAFWREAACDAAVITALDAPPQEYGRLLLHLGITRQRPALAAAGASWSFLSLKRRIEMLRQSSGRSLLTRAVTVSAVAFSLAAMVPVRVTARRAPSTNPASSAERTSPVEFQRSGAGRLNFVLFVDDHQTMSGSSADIERARRHRRNGERLMWFRHEGREFVVRDPQIIDEVLGIWVPVTELGSEQGKLGGEQGALGAKQGELGAKQGALGAEQGRLGARQGALGARQGMLAAQQAEIGKSETRRKAYEKEQLDIETEMEALDHEMKQIDSKMQELNEPMRELGDQMEVLGKEMEVLGRKMEEAAQKAENEMRALLERIVGNGTVQPVK